VDAFFDKVMVMVEDERIRANRLALLQTLLREFSTYGHFSEIVAEGKNPKNRTIKGHTPLWRRKLSLKEALATTETNTAAKYVSLLARQSRRQRQDEDDLGGKGGPRRGPCRASGASGLTIQTEACGIMRTNGVSRRLERQMDAALHSLRNCRARS